MAAKFATQYLWFETQSQRAYINITNETARWTWARGSRSTTPSSTAGAASASS